MHDTGKKRVLMISYYYPPSSSIGALRIGKFAKYLPEFGWEPVVLTSEIGDLRPPADGLEAFEVIRTPSFALASATYNALGAKRPTANVPEKPASDWKRLVHWAFRRARPLYTSALVERLVCDPIGWYFSARKAGLKTAREHPVDVIFSSSNPPTAHFIAAYLHRKTGTPWVAEYRDLWVDTYNARGRIHDLIERMLEKVVMRRVARLVAVSAPHASTLEKTHDKETTVITNGFDEPDYSKSVPLIPRFTITFTGNIYVGKRDPGLLFEAVSLLRREKRLQPNDIQIRFFGGSSLRNLLPLIDRYDLRDVVQMHDEVTYLRSIRKQQESAVLLLLEWEDPRARGVYSGKVFEYLGARRPILAIAYKCVFR